MKILYPETERVKNKVIQVKIGDALSGIDSYNGYIDGKWVNFYYDAKNDLMEYVIDGNCPKVNIF